MIRTVADGGDVEPPNGAARSIAGVCNGAGNVIGLMPHPERNADARFSRDEDEPAGAVFLRAFADMVSPS